jgi:hypothetical protein
LADADCLDEDDVICRNASRSRTMARVCARIAAVGCPRVEMLRMKTPGDSR